AARRPRREERLVDDEGEPCLVRAVDSQRFLEDGEGAEAAEATIDVAGLVGRESGPGLDALEVRDGARRVALLLGVRRGEEERVPREGRFARGELEARRAREVLATVE